jgi:putative ABC transport system permease protein
MNLNESIKVGLTGIASHKLRSSLTVLGIIFGVSAVIAMLSIGEGAKQETLEQIQVMGVNNIIVKTKSNKDLSDGSVVSGFSSGLTLKDAKAIAEICPLVESIAPHWETSAQSQYKDNQTKIHLVGTTPDYLSIYNNSLKSGKFILQDHIIELNNVCVLGSAAKDQLFHYEDPIGKKVKIKDLWFEVIGVLEPKLVSSKNIGDLDISDVNMNVFIPITTALSRLSRSEKKNNEDYFYYGSSGGGVGKYIDRTKVDQLTIKIKQNNDIEQAHQIIQRILSRRHFGAEDYQVIIPEELLSQSQKTQRIFNIVMGAIAGISLLVGGIGIMNIMLASVLERTREIGIRRAVGASKSDVLLQFLIEAIALSIVGGLIGIALGYGMTKIISFYAGWRTIVNSWSILLAFGVSAATGILFGFYPAKSAAEKEPIESLRYE